MSHPFDTLASRLGSTLPHSGEFDKPDTKPVLDLDSPVSPLRSRPASAATSSSSSSGSTASAKNNSSSSSYYYSAPTVSIASRKSDAGVYNHRTNNHSGDAPPRPGHRRSGSGPLIFSGGPGFSACSPATNHLPAGNICPSGKFPKPANVASPARSSMRADVLGTGSGNYGHGSVMRGNGMTTKNCAENGDVVAVKRAMGGGDPEELKRVGNELYRRGQFAEALRLYDKAIALCPENAAYRSNRAAALIGMKRITEAVKECEEAVRLDPAYGRAHHRLALLHFRLGQVESARKHLFLASPQPEPVDLQKIQTLERNLVRCVEARKTGDWRSVLRESEAAIVYGVDSSPLLSALKAEALLHLNQLDEADLALAHAFKLDASYPCNSDTMSLGMLLSSYINIVHAQIDMALGRFDNAAKAAEKARKVDPGSAEITRILNRVKSVARARERGNELFSARNFEEACLAYADGLKYDQSNPVLLCNRAACRSKLEQWERSVDDCNQALRIKPNYTKALLRRAASYCKLERWAEAVQDYEALQKELPTDTHIAEALFHAQVALKTSRGEEVSNMKFGGEVEKITGLEQFHESISLPGVSVVQFIAAFNHQCVEIASFVDGLCERYPLVSFLKVDVNEVPAIAKAENVRIVPTFKIYKKWVEGEGDDLSQPTTTREFSKTLRSLARGVAVTQV